MNIRKQLEAWLANNSIPANPGNKTNFEFLCENFCLSCIDSDTADDHALDLKLSQSNTSARSVFKFYPKNKVILISQRWISQTPFVNRHLLVDGQPVRVVDFFQWQPAPVAYRIIIYANKPLPVELYETKTDQNDSILNKSIFTQSNFKQAKSESGYIRIAPSNKSDSDIVILAFGHDIKPEQILKPEEVYRKLLSLTEHCRQYNITRYVRLKDRQSTNKLAQLWSTQKLIHPDMTLNATHPDLSQKLPWILLFSQMIQSGYLRANIGTHLCEKMHWDARDLFVARQLQLNLNSGKDVHVHNHDIFAQIQPEQDSGHLDFLSDNDFHVFYISLFTDLNSKTDIRSVLQAWWDLYSLPLFTLKLGNMALNSPEHLVVLTMLAFRNRLNWAELMCSILEQADTDPFYQLLINISGYLSVADANQDLNIHTGPMWANNSKAIALADGKGEAKYTRFGKLVFSHFRIDPLFSFSINHEVRFTYHQSEKCLTIEPYFCPVTIPNTYHLNYNGITYKIPFIWKKCEFRIGEVRFKVLFKKRRFQITVHSRKEDVVIQMKGYEQALIKHQKHVIYYTPEIIEPIPYFTISDESFRSHLISPAASQINRVVFSGWAFDRFGILPEYYIYYSAKKQHIMQASESGKFIRQSIIKHRQTQATIGFKQYRIQKELHYLEQPLVIRLIQSDVVSGSANIRILYTQGEWEDAYQFLTEFAEFFKFYPETEVYDHNTRLHKMNVYLRVTGAHNKVKLNDKSGFIELGSANNRPIFSDFINFLKSSINLT